MTTLAQYTSTVTLGVVATLPLEDSTSAGTLVTTYITNVGGWVPDSQGDPTGAGHLSNNFTTDQAIAAIAAQEYAKVYESALDLTMDLSFTTISHLTASLSENEIQAAIDGPIRDLISDYLATKGLTVSNLVLNSTTSTVGGTSDAARRVAIAAESPPVSLSAIGRTNLRTMFGLPATWGVFSYYIDSGSVAALIIKRYTDTSFATLDLTATNFYVVKVDIASKRVTSTVSVAQ